MQTFTHFIEQFHFIRPLWLLAIIPAVLLGWWLIKQGSRHTQSDWHKHVDAHLLTHLLVQKPVTQRKPWLPLAALLAVVSSIIAVAGPTWQKSDVPAFTGNDPTVIVLSLAQSMNEQDVSPSRLQRAVHKSKDILAMTEGDERALVIYADTAFTATPLTTDANVIKQMLPELSTSLMPVMGNRLDLAINEASNLLQQGKSKRGRMIVLADNAGDDPTASAEAAKAAQQQGFTVSVMGVGNPSNLKAGLTELKAVSKAGAGQYVSLASSDADIVTLLTNKAALTPSFMSRFTPEANQSLSPLKPASDADTQKANQQVDKWQDMGYWLLIIPVVLMPLLFKRGLLFVMTWMTFGTLVFTTLFKPQVAYAGVWSNLWATPNQQAQTAFANKNYAQAAKTFENNAWQASANYKTGNYQAAAKGFQQSYDHYNLGNALAKSGDLQGALNAYDAELKNHPNNKNAQFNRDLVEKLLQQQKNQQPQNNQAQSNNQSKNQKNSQKNQQNNQKNHQPNQSKDNQQQANNQSNNNQSNNNNKQPDNKQASQNSKKPDQNNPNQNKQKNQNTQAKNQQSQNKAKGKQQNAQQKKANDQAREQTNEQTKKQQAQQAKQAAKGTQTRKKLDQASAQKLRRVPDDPTGLLRARIRQHYFEQQLKLPNKTKNK